MLNIKAKINWLRQLPDHYLLVGILILNILIHLYAILNTVEIKSDEGVYLYAGKLMTEGFMPYRDFFLSHLPYYIFLQGLILKILDYNFIIYRLLYCLWCTSSIFPLFYLAKFISGKRAAAIFALLLFLTFPCLTSLDLTAFTLRPFAIPFLAFGLYFYYIKNRPIFSALCFSFFSLGILTNFLITGILFFIFYLNNPKNFLKKYSFWLTYFLVSGTLLMLVFLIPGAVDNLIFFQKDRLFMPFLERFNLLWNNITLIWPLLLFGLAGSLLTKHPLKYFGIFNIISLPLVVLGGKSFYLHYLSILSFNFALSASLCYKYFFKKIFKRLIYIISLAIFLQLGLLLITSWFRHPTPQFFSAVAVLNNMPEPIFSNSPIYALYAQKKLTYHKYVADMRYFIALHDNLTPQEYENIIMQSNTVLLDPYTQAFLEPEVLGYIKNNYTLIYSADNHLIYTR